MVSVQPVADLIAEVASAALETEVAFDFAALHTHDIQGRASALAKLNDDGYPWTKRAASLGWADWR